MMKVLVDTKLPGCGTYCEVFFTSNHNLECALYLNTVLFNSKIIHYPNNLSIHVDFFQSVSIWEFCAVCSLIHLVSFTSWLHLLVLTKFRVQYCGRHRQISVSVFSASQLPLMISFPFPSQSTW